MAVTPNGHAPKRRGVSRPRSFLQNAMLAMLAALFVAALIAQPVRVDGSSMMHSLNDKEMMLVTKYDYLPGGPRRFDVVVCRYPDRGVTNFVKRIVGLPGDTVSIRGGTLFVNGEMVDEDYLATRPDYFMQETTVGEGHYFVLGDNRANSSDSHLPAVGQLSRNQIIGKVRMVIWPLAEARRVR